MDSGTEQTDDKNIHFKHFDVTPLAEDHHYIKSNKHKTCFNDNNASVYAHIMKEWRILQKNLPESIYVQAYETRIDLLRAVIIGPAGTPYHDGLFFFDIVLPKEYPKKPPKVRYHSHGYRLNPNLYANGKVCLSLINTWWGSKCEKWSEKSTILQVLVSIQGLVLNERPFFNEPAYKNEAKGKEPRWINASFDYNEDAFVLSCKTMLQIMRKPPVHYEGFVLQHFRGRAGAILAAIEQYQQGHLLVGQFGMNVASTSSSSVRVSSKFKACLASIRPMLSSTFDGLVSEPDEALASTSETKKDVEKEGSGGVNCRENVEQRRKGIFDKLIGFPKKIWT